MTSTNEIGDGTRKPHSIAVIVPTFNEALHIRDCIESLEENHSDGNSIEIVIVDAGSSDGTQEIIGELGGRYANIKLMRLVARNIASQRNLAITNTEADIIINFSGHASAPENFIDTLVRELDSSEGDVAGVGCAQKLLTKDISSVSVSAFVITESLLGGRLIRPYQTTRVKGPVASVAFCAYRRGILRQVGLFDESNPYGDDADLNLRIWKSGFKLIFTPLTFVLYSPRSTLRGFLVQMFRNGRARMRMIVKNRALGMQAGKFLYFLPLFLPLYSLALVCALILGLPVEALALVSVGVYLVLVLASAAKLAVANRRFLLFFITPLMYFLEHFGYGVGMDSEVLALAWRRLFHARK